jgi:RNA polymerase sigma-70 factor (ECF subfamily)
VASSPDITRILKGWREGEPADLERLAPLVYDELRRIARRHMRREGPGHVLQTTALVNEAWVRMLGGARVSWQDRVHFFAVSSRIMRRILVDAARARLTGRRSGEQHPFQLNESIDAAPPRDGELVALDDALQSLAQFDLRKARVVEMRFFGGLSSAEIAAVLHVSPQTVMRDWRLARDWLTREIAGRGSVPDSSRT